MLAKNLLVSLLPLFAMTASAAPSSKPCKKSVDHSGGSGNSTSGSGNSTMDLNDKCAPGGNFDLSKFSLQLPTGKQYSPTTIQASQLSGCQGYSAKDVFFTEGGDGAMVMKVPGSPSSTGCVTTKNSKHCRTELRENGSWDPKAATNRLAATLVVPTADDSEHGTVVGQIHIDDSVSSKPVAELFLNKQGQLSMGVEQTRDGGNEKVTQVGSIQPGKQFSYEIIYEAGALSVAIDGAAPKSLSTYQLDSPKSYFKAGNYNQGNSASEVHFLALSVKH